MRKQQGSKSTPERNLKQQLLDELSGWRETLYPFWSPEQRAAAEREEARDPELSGLVGFRQMTDPYYIYYLYEGEDEPIDLPPDTVLEVIPDHYLDPAIDAYWYAPDEVPRPPDEVWVRGRGALQTEGRLEAKRRALEFRGATLENRVVLQPELRAYREVFPDGAPDDEVFLRCGARTLGVRRRGGRNAEGPSCGRV